MAAILPHLEIQNDPSETVEEELLFQGDISDEAAMEIAGGLGALRPGGELDPSKVAAKVLNHTHGELVRTAWIRRAVAEEIAGRTYTIYSKASDIWVDFGEPRIVGPQWSKLGSPTSRAALLTWTSKMGCPSFSLPAGPPMFGGACPGSTAGQTIVPLDALLKSQRQVAKHTGVQSTDADAVLNAICQRCYAEGENYAYASTQLAQIMRFAWVKVALEQPAQSGAFSTLFAEVLHAGIARADFKLDAFQVKKVTVRSEHRGKFFRIHDSGDFFAMPYYDAWVEVARANPDITFWAPSRVWAAGDAWIDHVNENTAPNLVVRPRGYYVNEAAPDHDLGPGWASWTTCFSKGVMERESLQVGPEIDPSGPYNWNCQTYSVVNEAHNCRNAIAPDGSIGCRACWVRPELVVNYTEH
jgi:hypothetical protein